MAGTKVLWRLFSVHVHNAAVRVRLQFLPASRRRVLAVRTCLAQTPYDMAFALL
jgi:hypothetical protein